jgi:hypothetical protein
MKTITADMIREYLCDDLTNASERIINMMAGRDEIPVVELLEFDGRWGP